jgi:putative oxidoreductase
MRRITKAYDRLVSHISGGVAEGVALLIVRLALAGVFWRSGRSKVVEGSWLQISDGALYLFENDYSNVPLPPDLAAHLALISETLFPVLLVIGLLTRLSAAALLGMTLVIQVFVFPDAFWTTHSLWIALAGILIVRGGGLFSIDSRLVRATRA